MNKSLGRGLSAFLDDLESDDQKNKIVKIDPNRVRPNPFQPRRIFDDESLNSLAKSIKRNGVFQPILVIRSGAGDDYQLVAGERRLRASKIAGLDEIPAILVDFSEKDQLEIALLENIQRENLNPLEEAEAYRRLMEEFQYTQEELSETLGKSRSHVANMLRLLSLPNEVKALINDGKLSFGHARTLVGIDNAPEIARQIINKSLNVRQAESIAKQRKSGNSGNLDPEISNVAEQISSLTGLNANIKLRGSGGVIEIGFSNFQELDSFMAKLNR
ncbi:MAG: ParB/RepB/Spo0J family partition protein [Holosporaceae bacterium]|jgi:ParB family chromosome partitioning protein|nr:ParB/RepB/Spo0J family partition protein [Holosporaceae bacterium]